MILDSPIGRLSGGEPDQDPVPLIFHSERCDGTAVERDLRLDLCRGIALWCIFLDHIPNNVFSWLTLRHYGFSDATEVFMFVSGVTCGLAYNAVRLREGWGAVFAHTLLRSWEIYAAFLILIIVLVMVVHGSGSGELADEANVKILLQAPGAALTHAAILQYRPVNTDVLPTFVLFHLSFAPVLWGVLKFPGMAGQPVVLQSACLAIPGRPWCVVGDPRLPDVSAENRLVACRGARDSVYRIWSCHCIELGNRAIGSRDPGLHRASDLSHRQARS
jgi:hypothetical protein